MNLEINVGNETSQTNTIKSSWSPNSRFHRKEMAKRDLKYYHQTKSPVSAKGTGVIYVQFCQRDTEPEAEEGKKTVHRCDSFAVAAMRDNSKSKRDETVKDLN